MPEPIPFGELIPVPLIVPGFAGLNKQVASNTANLGPEWAIDLLNTVVDDSGRVAARKGWANQAGTPISGTPNIEAIGEQIKADATTAIVVAANNKLFSGVSSYTDITGTLTITGNSWQFLNFGDALFGVQAGHTPWRWTGSGNAAVIAPTSGTLPTGNCGVSAFGRLWIADANGYLIKYCGLLDYQNWGAAGSGSIDMRNIWTLGADTVMGITSLGSSLVVFGKRHIVFIQDGSKSTLGMDPTKIYVSDVITGTGLVARDSIQAIGQGDLWYLSPYGVQSLQRVITVQNNPLATVSQNVKDYLQSYIGTEDVTKVRSLYSNSNAFYLLILPATGRVFCFDARNQLPDGTARVSEWTSMAPKSGITRLNGDVLFGFAGRLGLHANYLDNATTYRLVYASPHLPLGEQLANRLKMLKRIGTIVYTQVQNNLVFKWGFDFAGLLYSLTQPLAGGQVPEYGTAEFGANGKYNVNDPNAVAGTNVSEYGGGVTLRVLQGPLSGSGRWIQVGLEMDINGSGLAIQELDLYAKVGRVT